MKLKTHIHTRKETRSGRSALGVRVENRRSGRGDSGIYILYPDSSLGVQLLVEAIRSLVIAR